MILIEQESINDNGDILKGIHFNISNLKAEVRTLSGTATADSDYTGLIRFSIDRLHEVNDSVIYHEIAHQLTNYSRELQIQVIISKIFGTYHSDGKFSGHYEGAWGEYNAEEAFATSVSVYCYNKQELKTRYPIIYDFIEYLFSNTNAQEFVDTYYKICTEVINDVQQDGVK